VTDQSVFNDQNPATPPANQQQQAPASAYQDLLAGIKNDAGLPKYATVDEALKALAHSQAYIPEVKNQLSQREQELAALRAELEQRQSIEDVVSRLATQNQPAAVVDQPLGSGLDESAVMKLVQQHLEQREAATAAQANQQQVEATLRAKFGDRVGEVVQQRAAELGLTPKALGELSSRSPAAVLALFNASGAPAPKPTTSSVHIPATQQQGQPPLERPAKSLLSGAKTQDQVAFMAKIREKVYLENGINQ
jgi:hypothetical protein